MTSVRSSVIQGFFSQGTPRIIPASTPVRFHLQAPSPAAPAQRQALQRFAPPPGRALQRAAGPAAPHHGNVSATLLPPNLAHLGRGVGQKLPAPLLQKMEAALGASFADVRVHIGPEPASIGALAFTHGSDLYFAPGQYNPTTSHGQQLLGHELAHVIQQRAGRVVNPFGSGIALVHDRMLEAEADRLGRRAAALPMRAPARVPAVQPFRAPGTRAHARRWVVQPLLATYSRKDLNYDDDAEDWHKETIGLIRHIRASMPNEAKQKVDYYEDGIGTDGGYKHYVPANWIYKALIDNYIHGERRVDAQANLARILLKLGIKKPDIEITNKISYDAWLDQALNSIVDWPENIYRHSKSTGDGRGTKLDTPIGLIKKSLKVRLTNAKNALEAAIDGVLTPLK